MEKGHLRADVNVSVRKPGDPLGTRCEIKNLNSIRFIGQAIEHEARRQIEVIEDGGSIEQETRLFDPDKGETRSMRSKEEAHDYRYFPDPDLLPLELSPSLVNELRSGLPELPDAKRVRFMQEYALSRIRCRCARRRAAEYCRLFREQVGRKGSRYAQVREAGCQLGDRMSLPAEVEYGDREMDASREAPDATAAQIGADLDLPKMSFRERFPNAKDVLDDGVAS